MRVSAEETDPYLSGIICRLYREFAVSVGAQIRQRLSFDIGEDERLY